MSDDDTTADAAGVTQPPTPPKIEGWRKSIDFDGIVTWEHTAGDTDVDYDAPIDEIIVWIRWGPYEPESHAIPAAVFRDLLGIGEDKP